METDISNAAVTTPFGRFEFVRKRFGLRNAAQTFQKFRHQITRGLANLFVYMEDIRVARGSNTPLNYMLLSSASAKLV